MIATATLNSNLILLIQIALSPSFLYNVCFKFQSDSINTDVGVMKDFTFDSLNSNLILLIQEEHAIFYHDGAYFKFQSDSINT